MINFATAVKNIFHHLPKPIIKLPDTFKYLRLALRLKMSVQTIDETLAIIKRTPRISPKMRSN